MDRAGTPQTSAELLNVQTLQQIRDLESKMLRAIREHLLGDPAALARIKTTDDQIAALRAQLTPE